MTPKLIKFEDTEKLNDFIKQINFTEMSLILPGMLSIITIGI